MLWSTMGMRRNVFIVIIFILGAECQEPTTTRKSNENELFKATETATDINTTPPTAANSTTMTTTTITTPPTTEIDNNAQTMRSGGGKELSLARDSNSDSNGGDDDTTDKVPTTTEEETTTGEWSTLPTTQNELLISIKDVFEKSLDVVNDEMKGIGIIQDWLKEKASEVLTGTEEYDDYTETEDYKETTEETTLSDFDDVTTIRIGEGVNKENFTEPDVGKRFEEETKIVQLIENDLDKLNQLQVEQGKADHIREEIITDIEKKLNALEVKSSGGVKLTEPFVTDNVEAITAPTTEIEIDTEETTVVAGNAAQDQIITTIKPIDITDNETDVISTTEIVLDKSKSNETMEPEITPEIEDKQHTTEVVTDINDERTTTRMTTETNNMLADDKTTLSTITTEPTTTVTNDDKNTMTTNINLGVEEETTTLLQPNDKDLILTIIPVRKVETTIQPEITTVEASSTIPSIKVPTIDEIIEDIIESHKITTTEDGATALVEEELDNITKTIQEILSQDSNTLSNDDDEVSTSSEETTEVTLADNHDIKGLENTLQNEHQPLDKDAIIKSITHEFLTSEEVERQKILADYAASNDDDGIPDFDDYADISEEIPADNGKIPSTAEPIVKALVTDEANGRICLNASGLAIKITSMNNSIWLPASTRVFGRCTSFGAYLNLTWRHDNNKHEDGLKNDSLSFTFVGDSEESYIEEVVLRLSQETYIASQIEQYLTEPTEILLPKGAKLTLSHIAIQLFAAANKKGKGKETDDEFATTMLSADNALALQIASGGLCIFIIVIAVSVFTYKKLKGQARIFKVSLDK